jgi:hypothetical protein
VVEPQPSKLMTAVRVRSPAPLLGARWAAGAGQGVLWGTIFCPHSSVVEHFLGKEEVTGSSPVVGSRLCWITGAS